MLQFLLNPQRLTLGLSPIPLSSLNPTIIYKSYTYRLEGYDLICDGGYSRIPGSSDSAWTFVATLNLRRYQKLPISLYYHPNTEVVLEVMFEDRTEAFIVDNPVWVMTTEVLEKDVQRYLV